MTTIKSWLAIIAVGCLALCSCGKAEPFRKETYPVMGTVYVDGEAADHLQVYCHDLHGMDAVHPTKSSAFTEKDGEFKISTYESGDGVPESEYALTFKWCEYNAFSGGYDGPDRLKGRYEEPSSDRLRFKVEKGKATDLGRIDLSTK